MVESKGHNQEQAPIVQSAGGENKQKNPTLENMVPTPNSLQSKKNFYLKGTRFPVASENTR